MSPNYGSDIKFYIRRSNTQRLTKTDRLKPFVTSQFLVNISYALVYPYLTYGCLLWGNNYEAPLLQLVRLKTKLLELSTVCHFVITLLPIM